MKQASTFRMHFIALDSWRGICAIMVVIYHSQRYGHSHNLLLVSNSYLFVDFFFVLSGFIIFQVYGNTLLEKRDVIRFIVRRFGRLFPLHLFVLIVLLGYEFLRLVLIDYGGMRSGVAPFQSPERGVGTFFLNLLFLNSMGLYEKGSWNTPSWSVGAEFYTYLLFAFTAPLQKYKWIFVGGLLTVAAAGMAIIFSKSPDFMNATYDLGLVRCVIGFSIGVVVSIMRAPLKRYIARISFSSLMLFVEIATVFLVLYFVSYAGHGPVGIFAPIIFSFAVFVFSFESGGISRALSWAPFQFVGRLSFSIYMVHIPIIIFAEILRKRVFEISLYDTILGDLFGVAVVLLVISVSAFTYNTVESPYREKFKKLSNRLAAKGERALITPRLN